MCMCIRCSCPSLHSGTKYFSWTARVIQLLLICFRAKLPRVVGPAREGGFSQLDFCIEQHSVYNLPVEFSCDENPQQRVVSKQFGGIISYYRLVPRRVSISALGLKYLFKGQDHSSLQYSRNPSAVERGKCCCCGSWNCHVIAVM